MLYFPLSFFFLGSCSPAFLTKNLGKNNFVLIGLDLFSVLYCISDFIDIWLYSLILHLVRLKKCLPMARYSCNMLRYKCTWNNILNFKTWKHWSNNYYWESNDDDDDDKMGNRTELWNSESFHSHKWSINLFETW